jgi:pimeloyl-ACP methyl ester carboxylesterase
MRVVTRTDTTSRALLKLRDRELEIAYRARGEGSPVVLVHGLGASSTAWHYQLDALAGSHRVFALDLPGHGRTPLPRDAAGGEFAAEVVAAFLEQVAGAPAAVAGHSMGGAISLLVALRRPQLVSSLALVSSAGLGSEMPLFLRALCAPGADRLMETVGPLLVRAISRVPALRRRVAGGAAGDILAPVMAEALEHYRRRRSIRAFTTALRAGATTAGQDSRYVLLDRLCELDVPILVVWGRDDRVLPLEHGLRAAELSRGRLAVLECGHSPMLEAAALFTELLGEFFSAPAWRPALA